VTDRRLSSSVAVITGHRGKQVEDRRVDWEGIARSAETLVILMGTRWLDDIVRRVIEGGRDPATPAALIAHGTTPRQRVVVAPLAELPGRARAAGLSAPTIVVVGEVVRFRETIAWFERRPLFGRRVLVTRAQERAGELAAALAARGAAPVLVPLLAFAPPADPAALAAAFARADDYDWLVLTSATALRFAPPLALRRARVACVGPATAAAARRAGLEVAVEPAGRSVPSELVAAMTARAPLAGASVLFPCAARAREELPAALAAAGVRVDRVVAYATVVPDEAAAELRKALAQPVDAVSFASPSAVAHLFELLGEPRARELAQSARFAAIGPTTAAALAARGVTRAVVSQRQTGEDLAQALEAAFAEEPHAVP
jgi:uroporphyrinogen III methyltransferase/synthase